MNYKNNSQTGNFHLGIAKKSGGIYAGFGEGKTTLLSRFQGFRLVSIVVV